MVSSNCCKGGNAAECICAQNATCSCGKQSALHCNCDRASAENTTSGDRCSCGQRPAGACTCATNPSEVNTANETDFTTRK
ncbi:hypothetical protein Sste5346_009832 [Sporothrix stenoceras]|uniref:DUF7871 domain-containing protein n=1 Tax=Sporothrix stenoceras TaxID=5173 RepID=A0ABR3YJ32_9PEZI